MRDLRELFDPNLHLPINGKTYTITSPNAEEGLRLRLMFSTLDAKIGDDDQVGEIAKLLGATWVPNMVTKTVLDIATGEPILDENNEPTTVEVDEGKYEGGVWSEMANDGVDWVSLMHAGTTALLYYGQGPYIGEIYWETGLTDTPGNSLPPKPGTATGDRSSNPQRRKNAKRNNRKRK
ncbi:hypothetical protein ACIGKR_12010 [Rhodococcus qingshengii]|uniref:DUF7426 family protein n=1 Tax=Rhodococcus qingshengii TaxID=334542 RepID=UPI0037C576A6